MSKVVTIDVFKERIKGIHGDFISLDESTYINMKIKCRFIDKDFGQWWALPGNVIRGAGHKQRGNEKRRLTQEEAQKRLLEIHNGNVELDFSTYKGLTKKARFIDKDYGEWWAKPMYVIGPSDYCGHKVRGYKISGEKSKISVEEAKKRLFKIHGDKVILDESTYINMTTKCRFIDKDYGEWWIEPHCVINKKVGHKERFCKKISEIKLIPVQKIKERLKKIHGDAVVLDETTYVNKSTKCIFIDKDFGKWLTNPGDVLNGHGHPKRGRINAKQTCLKKFGVEYPSQNREIRLKQIRSSNKHTLKYNWETNEEVDCTASYECAVVDTWNGNKERFGWQIPFKNEEKGYVYFVDAYLIDRDTYIEIKRIFLG